MIELDGTADTAAAAIDQLPAAESYKDAPADVAKSQDRASDGKFQKPAGDADKTDSGQKQDEDKTGGEDEDDEDYLEWDEAPETEGAEAKRERVKVSEALEGYRKAKTLETQLAEAKQAQPLPEHLEEQVAGIIQERTQYTAALQKWAQFNRPQPPNQDLLNPYGANHNPDQYYQDLQTYQQAVQNQQRVAAELQRMEDLNTKQAHELHRSRLIRERAQLEKVWPEYLKDEAYARKAKADLKQHFGFTDAEIDSVVNAKFYALAKDALAYRTSQAAKKEAVRVVRDKPKLVRAAARSTTNPKAAAYQNSFGALSKSGSIDDAAAAIAAL